MVGVRLFQATVAISTIGLLTAVGVRPIHLSDQHESERAQSIAERSSVWWAIVTYAADNGDKIPAFDSKHLPSWWKEYKGPNLSGKVEYEVNPAFVGQNPERFRVGSRQVLLESGGS